MLHWMTLSETLLGYRNISRNNVTPWFSGDGRQLWRQSYKKFSLKKTNLVLNLLVVHYINYDCNKTVVRSQLRQCTINKFKTNSDYLITKFIFLGLTPRPDAINISGLLV